MVGLLLVYSTNPPVSVQPTTLSIVFALAVTVGIVAHELGHLLACLAVGAQIKARLGPEHGAIRFRVRNVQVSLGWPYQGRVEHVGASSLGRRAVITLAGSLMDLAVAGLLLLLSLGIAASPRDERPLVVTAAVGIGVTGLINLMPFRSRSGRLSDGARLFELRSDTRAAQAVEAQKTASKLRREGRTFDVALMAGLPREDAALAEQRVTVLLRDHDLGRAQPVAYLTLTLTLALLRLRLGGPVSHAKAEQICDQALAAKVVPDSVRRMALAAVIVSRQARGLPYEDVRTTAATLKTAKQAPETMAASLRAARPRRVSGRLPCG